MQSLKNKNKIKKIKRKLKKKII